MTALRKKAVAFLKKSSAKNFYYFGAGSFMRPRPPALFQRRVARMRAFARRAAGTFSAFAQSNESLFGSFSSEKERLPSPALDAHAQKINDNTVLTVPTP